MKRRNEESGLQLRELEKLIQRRRNGSTEPVGIKISENHRLMTLQEREKMLKRRNKESNLQLGEFGELTQRGRNGSIETIGIKISENHRLLTFKEKKKIEKEE